MSEIQFQIWSQPKKTTVPNQFPIPDFYLSALQKVWLESQQAWLNGVYEGRLRNIYIYPPPGDRQIILALTKLHLHDLVRT